MTTELKKILLFCLGFILLYNLFFFKVSLGLGFVIIIIFLNTYFFFIKEKSEKNIPFALLNSFLGVLFSFLFAYRGNEVVRFFDFLLSGTLTINALFLYRAKEEFKVNILDYLLLPLQVFVGSIQGLGEMGKQSHEKSETKSVVNASYIRGVVIAVPLFLILLALLSNADPIFGKFTGDIFSSLGDRVLFCLGFVKATVQKNEIVEHGAPAGKIHELSLILGSIIVLFTSFIVIQFRYLFTGVSERELAQVGVKSLTYSQYVNQGFFELLVVGAISSIVLVYVIHSIHKLHSGEKVLTQILGGLLGFETWLILLSDFKRLSLYAGAHGLTRARVFGFIFLVWLTLYLLLLLWQMLQKLTKEMIFLSLFTITITILLLTNIFNIDSVIATQYVPMVNGEVDYFYTAGLSVDASASWKTTIIVMNQQITDLEKVQNLSADDSRKIYWINSTLDELKSSVSNLKHSYSPENFRWQSMNVSEFIAYQTILQNQDTFQALNNIAERGKALDTRISPEVRSNTSLDRSTNPPLSQ